MVTEHDHMLQLHALVLLLLSMEDVLLHPVPDGIQIPPNPHSPYECVLHNSNKQGLVLKESDKATFL